MSDPYDPPAFGWNDDPFASSPSSLNPFDAAPPGAPDWRALPPGDGDGFGRFGDPLLPQPERSGAGCRSARPSRRTSAVAFFEEEPEADDPLLGFAPYIHAAPRRNSITPERQRAFIAALAGCGIVTQAARSIGASLEALYRLRHRKGAEGFAAAWERALDRGVLRLEDCALERAIRGEERPVASQGKVVATYLRHDTALMLFLLRHRRAQRYAEGGGGGIGGRRDPQPGSALYERIVADYKARQPSSEEVIESINAKIERIRQRRLAHAAELAEEQERIAQEEMEGYWGT
ncbi:hypothetical protein AB3M93_01915 [Novosphingobium panipatense]|jgi:hypothetical protein|uniref:hypothetical protein n=1 Tax=Novosphingobium TaxID=165696 RepID=UPI001E42A760|nr:hypothetical protein [Novosphingobium sp. HII-3]